MTDRQDISRVFLRYLAGALMVYVSLKELLRLDSAFTQMCSKYNTMLPLLLYSHSRKKVQSMIFFISQLLGHIF